MHDSTLPSPAPTRAPRAPQAVDMSARPHTVRRLIWHSASIYELLLERDGLHFEPGDCLSLTGPDGSTRPYSIASGTHEDVLRFLIRRLPQGRVSGALAALQPGDTVSASPPYGWFRPSRSAGVAPYIYIATSTGIAPYLASVRSGLATPPERILYGVRTRAEAVGLDLLAAVAPVTLALSRQAPSGPGQHPGHVTDLLADLPLTPRTQVYLCGLDAMIADVSDWLEAHGLDFTHIHREVFFHARI